MITYLNKNRDRPDYDLLVMFLIMNGFDIRILGLNDFQIVGKELMISAFYERNNLLMKIDKNRSKTNTPKLKSIPVNVFREVFKYN